MNHRGGRLPVWVIAVVAWLGGDAWSADPGDVAKLVARRGGRIVELSGGGEPGRVRLALGGTQVSDADLDQLVTLPRLAEIDLSATLVTDRGASRLAGCRTLESIDLSRTRISDAGLSAMAELPHLTSLRVGFTRVRGRGLAGLRRLETLGLDGPQTS
ncbi:MAG TPA: hypothetical protein DCE39_03715, partial [Planctomycetaceae bacterium]|nr:hypothetical protein [Planctomycetaceae bacterium]